MSSCPSCGHANTDDARFCPQCGVALVAVPSQAREERKVITVLFADLVGFTLRSEQLDPEDVRALLSPYYAHVRNELERHGGTVEKFIGDAVMALFGAPVSHEDDPERAVRAALAIRDWARADDKIQVRIAVNTGEALVSLGARPVEGEGMAAGDVVNTTARLQTAAPVNGVLVGERTYRATNRAVEYASAPAVEAKGKQLPVQAWEAMQARSRFGIDVPAAARAALVGRERELGVLLDALERVQIERTAQLVTLIGVPGIGKSRLLYELSRAVDADSETIVAWRQGRSLPYGEGVGFWAFAEMVKAQAGILDSEPVEIAETKLTNAVDDVVADAAEAEWVRRHLRELVGLRKTGPAHSEGREEVFAAWRRFVEALADQRPLVLLFEDLHWADDGLLEFIDHLVDWVTDVPLLVVCSARPELLGRRPGWGGGKSNSSTLSLAPLSQEETSRLIAALLHRPLLDAGQLQELLLRAAGNPLFAEQYVQMLAEHDIGTDLPVPETVQDLIGARLDSLPAEDKRLLQHAAVVGKVFWTGAVAALSDEHDRTDLPQRLHELTRRQFVRRERRSSLASEEQYAFLHVLLRDIAYAQIPRTARIDEHVRAARWIESLRRPEDFAEMLAHHYAQALELMRATGRDGAELAVPARRALQAAGERALALSSFETAAATFEAARALWPETNSPEHATLVFLVAVARVGQGIDDPAEEMERARDALLAAGMSSEAAEAEARLASIWWFRGHRDRANEHVERAEALVREQSATAHKVYVLNEVARIRMLAGDNDLEVATEGLRLAEDLKLDDMRAHLAVTIGTVHGRSGNRDGIEEIQRGLDLALSGNHVNAASRGYSNLAAIKEMLDGDQLEVLRIGDESLALALRIGAPGQLRWARGNRLACLFELGRWDEFVSDCTDFLAESAVIGGHYHDAAALLMRARIRSARGDVSGSLADQRAALARARDIKDAQIMMPTLVHSANVFLDAGDRAAAAAALDELLASDAVRMATGIDSVDLVQAARQLGRRQEIAAWLADRPDSPYSAAASALLADDFDIAVTMLDSMNALRCAALTRLEAARAGATTARPAAWRAHLKQSLAFFQSVDASRLVSEAESLLPASA